ncbi:MAG: DEAD/DEAH box helicase [Chloroflexi bacterium]|nr:DEAD/DEAH box helicase [Chloroflexota bacterium]
MSVEDTIEALRADAEFMRDVVEWQRAPARLARAVVWPSGLGEDMRRMYAERGIEQPYVHQAEAIGCALAGRHVAVVASAAGGKSLCFHAPILQRLLDEPNARALCLFPTRALTQDQLASFVSEAEHLFPSPRARTIVSAYDGDTPQAKRADIRRDARVIVTNADMLHLGILPHHARWSAFFRNLRFVVIDEMHTYRGIFGSHVANVLRRLRRICAFYGATPTFVLASATIANPRDHAERLIELPVELIDDDGSPHGEQHVVIVNPPLVDADLGMRRSADFVVRDIAGRLIDDGLQTICFARSRNSTEVLLTYLRDRLGHRLSAMSGQPVVVGYRGGYLAEERRSIERGLREGHIRGVASTNALELGIDIGELDACVMHGYPGTIASFWQQSGRAGRRRRAAVAVMVATADPLDQYLAAHPNYLFEQSPEHARIAPDNLGVLAQHTACAAFELPFERGERLGLAEIGGILDVLVEEGDLYTNAAPAPLLRSADGARGDAHVESALPQRYTWIGDTYPAERVSLRGMGDRVNIVDERGELLGETERVTAPSRVHIGAIYLHQGQTYRIVELDWLQGRAVARRVDSDYYTQPSSVSEVAVLEEFDVNGAAYGSCPVAHGQIEVTTSVPRFRQVMFSTHQTIGWGEVDLPEQLLLTTGYWFSIGAELSERLSRRGILALPNDYGPNAMDMRARNVGNRNRRRSSIMFITSGRFARLDIGAVRTRLICRQMCWRISRQYVRPVIGASRRRRMATRHWRGCAISWQILHRCL